MVWSPSGSELVEMVATPPETLATPLFGAQRGEALRPIAPLE